MCPAFLFRWKAKLDTNLVAELVHLLALEGLAVVRDQQGRLWFVTKPFLAEAFNDISSGLTFHF